MRLRDLFGPKLGDNPIRSAPVRWQRIGGASPDGIEPWLNLSDAARVLKIASKTLRLAAEAGEIEARHPLSDGPWIFARAELMTDAAKSIAERAPENARYPAGRPQPTKPISTL
jgi:hypothetical protein